MIKKSQNQRKKEAATMVSKKQERYLAHSLLVKGSDGQDIEATRNKGQSSSSIVQHGESYSSSDDSSTVYEGALESTDIFEETVTSNCVKGSFGDVSSRFKKGDYFVIGDSLARGFLPI